MSNKSSVKEKRNYKFDQYCELLEGSPIAIGVQSKGKIVFVNSTGSRLLNLKEPRNLIGKSFSDFMHHDYKDLTKSFFNNIEKNELRISSIEVKTDTRNGLSLFLEVRGTPFEYNHKPAVSFTFHEITRRKEMEDVIVQSRHEWAETFNAITDMVTIHDKDFNIVYANKAAEKILKLPTAVNNSGIKCFKFYHGANRPPEGCPSCDSLKTGKPANFEIYEPHLKMHIEIRSMPRFDKNNQLIGLIHIARDVTERKKAVEEINKTKINLEKRVEERTAELKTINEQLKEEASERKFAVEALKKNENRYRNLSKEFNVLLNGIPDNLILLSPDLKIMWANKAAARTFGKDLSELSGQYCYSLCCNIFSPCQHCPTLKSFPSGKEESAQISTASDRIWDIRAFPIKDETGKVKSVIELARDITEKVNLQAGATRTRHLASLGELAAGVAHEINNPINNIINYAQILIDEYDKESRDDEIPRRIIKDSDRIATIVRSLLSFARIRSEEKNYHYLHEIFSDTIALTSAQIRKDGINLKVNLPSKFIKIPVHQQQIQQVFLNIISNSRFALNRKYPGTHEDKVLEISIEKISIDDAPHCQIIFRDTGTGIPDDIIDKVINPFFSTKPNRIGTGLGLSISHGIISEHGGKLLINSVEGEYTKLIIDLPLEHQEED
jgi:PAS domain S-box-containing protein